MRRQDKLKRDMLLERSLMEQRLADFAATLGDHQSEKMLRDYQQKTERSLDELMDAPPARLDRVLELGERMLIHLHLRKPAPPSEQD